PGESRCRRAGPQMASPGPPRRDRPNRHDAEQLHGQQSGPRPPPWAGPARACAGPARPRASRRRGETAEMIPGPGIVPPGTTRCLPGQQWPGAGALMLPLSMLSGSGQVSTLPQLSLADVSTQDQSSGPAAAGPAPPKSLVDAGKNSLYQEPVDAVPTPLPAVGMWDADGVAAVVEENPQVPRMLPVSASPIWAPASGPLWSGVRLEEFPAALGTVSKAPLSTMDAS